jgi:sec-independent protein translocase protein TatA
VHPPGLFQLLFIALIILVLFGRGRISGVMGDFGKGVKSFRKSLAEDDEPVQPVRIDGPGPHVGPAGEASVEPQAAPDQTRS